MVLPWLLSRAKNLFQSQTTHNHTPTHRDNFFRELLGYPEMSDAELAFQRKTWAASTAMSMYIEFTSIITSRIMYLAFRQHRFVINLGYGFDSSDANMTTVTMLMTSVFIELIFEAVVDAYALEVEHGNGINLDDFWDMWKVVSLIRVKEGEGQPQVSQLDTHM